MVRRHAVAVSKCPAAYPMLTSGYAAHHALFQHSIGDTPPSKQSALIPCMDAFEIQMSHSCTSLHLGLWQMGGVWLTDPKVGKAALSKHLPPHGAVRRVPGSALHSASTHQSIDASMHQSPAWLCTCLLMALRDVGLASLQPPDDCAGQHRAQQLHA
eukprot:1147523-Pelagomonas_calceolata.AAC.3